MIPPGHPLAGLGATTRSERVLHRPGAAGVVGDSQAIRRLRELIRLVAASGARTVLLEGETGTGKGLVARALHEESARAQGPFVTVTCSAIPETLLEAELFGHEAGAFTDARARKAGVFEAADGGTLFVDEVGDLSAGLQGKFLGVLEDRRFRRLGGCRELETDTRVVSATNRDLCGLEAAGAFRADLLYRLRVVVVDVPPLRERSEDVPALVRHFAAQLSAAWGQGPIEVAEDAMEALSRRPWPGNVRQLRNVVERAAVLHPGCVLEARHFVAPEHARTGARGPSIPLPPGGLRLREVIDDLVCQALRRTHDNQSAAARLLGVSRDFVKHRLRRLHGAAPEAGCGPGTAGEDVGLCP